VLIVGFGEGGRYLAKALTEGEAPNLLAYDPALSNPAVAYRLREAAEALGVVLRAELGAWLGEVDIVFSLVPGTAAVEAALALAGKLRAGAIFVDLNSITGELMCDVAAPLLATGVRVVDGCVLGNFQGGTRVPILLVGDGAKEIATLLPPQSFIIDIISGAIGDASTIKMLRSILMKGLEALCIECLVAAERRGVRETLLRAFKDLDERSFVRTMEILTVTHVLHAERRLKEVDRVLSVLAKEGVWSVMTEATRQVFRNTVEAEMRPPDGRLLPFAETLQRLDAIYRRYP
jgi:3-hydroxyisobutyrate dehydrogenase-like beta-hydroxyacid dehydrogenase